MKVEGRPGEEARPEGQTTSPSEGMEKEQGSSCFGPLNKLATAPGAGSGGEAPRRHGVVHSVTLFFSYRNGDLSGKTSNYCLLLTKVTEWGT